MKRFVGIDVGGTRIKAGLVDASQKITNDEVVWLEDADKTEDGLLKQLGAIVPRVIGGQSGVVAVGLGVAGVVSRWEGSIKRSPNFPNFHDFRLKERLEKVLDHHVELDNDANCVVAGEFLQGQVAHALARRGSRDLIGLTLGTGVGGAIILHGSLWRGVTGMAAELGHIVVDPAGAECGCGSRGCLETYASVIGLRRMCASEPVDGVDASAADLPQHLAGAAESGDATAKKHFAAAGTALGRALGGLLNTFNIKTFLIAGGLSPAFRWMEAACVSEMQRCSFDEINDGAEIVTASMGEKAGVLGAAMQWLMAPHD